MQAYIVLESCQIPSKVASSELTLIEFPSQEAVSEGTVNAVRQRFTD